MNPGKVIIFLGYNYLHYQRTSSALRQFVLRGQCCEQSDDLGNMLICGGFFSESLYFLKINVDMNF